MTETPTTFYCVNHPSTETSLRCNNCEDPICPKCAVLTPTGYRCRKCVRSQQKKFDTSEWYDYPLAFIISTMIAFLGSLIVPFVNFFILFIAPIVGIAIAEAIRFVTRKRRSNSVINNCHGWDCYWLLTSAHRSITESVHWSGDQRLWSCLGRVLHFFSHVF